MDYRLRGQVYHALHSHRSTPGQNRIRLESTPITTRHRVSVGDRVRVIIRVRICSRIKDPAKVTGRNRRHVIGGGVDGMLGPWPK